MACDGLARGQRAPQAAVIGLTPSATPPPTSPRLPRHRTASPRSWPTDDQAGVISLPFAFHFYGTRYTTAFVSSNGLLSFGGPNDSSPTSP
ncbi:MAG: hypothetical protein WKF75_02080 [Singulisphaera sp.]